MATQEQGPSTTGPEGCQRRADLRAESTWHFLELPTCLLQGRTGLRGLLLLERVGSTDVCGHRHLGGSCAREGARTVQCQEEPLPAPLGCPPNNPAPDGCPPPSPPTVGAVSSCGHCSPQTALPVPLSQAQVFRRRCEARSGGEPRTTVTAQSWWWEGGVPREGG